MSTGVGLRYDVDFSGVREHLGAVHEKVERPEALMLVVGRRGANELKQHFWKRDKEGNKLGAKRSHFWRHIADAVHGAPGNEGDVVLESMNVVGIDISDAAFAQKLFGGTIRPKTKDALTIAVDPLSYGRPVSTFTYETGIELFRLKKSGGVLTNLLMGAEANGDVKVFYILSDHVTQQADPEALPPQDQFEAALNDEADKLLRAGTS